MHSFVHCTTLLTSSLLLFIIPPLPPCKPGFRSFYISFKPPLFLCALCAKRRQLFPLHCHQRGLIYDARGAESHTKSLFIINIKLQSPIYLFNRGNKTSVCNVSHLLNAVIMDGTYRLIINEPFVNDTCTIQKEKDLHVV